MPNHPPPGAAAEEIGPFQFVVLVLSVVALAAIVADVCVPLPGEISRLLHWVDHVVCGAFFLDFVLRFRAAESKLRFMRWGWIDLLASIPTVQALRFGRLVWVLRVLRLLRGVRSLRRLVAVLFVNPRRGGAASVGLATFLLIITSSAAMLWFERVEGANIRTAGDAVWWSVATVTTVGYGDRYPVTTEGRMVAGTLMIAGVGLFGALSGLVASLFLGVREDQKALAAEIRAVRTELERLRADRTDRGPADTPRQ